MYFLLLRKNQIFPEPWLTASACLLQYDELIGKIDFENKISNDAATSTPNTTKSKPLVFTSDHAGNSGTSIYLSFPNLHLSFRPRSESEPHWPRHTQEEGLSQDSQLGVRLRR